MRSFGPFALAALVAATSITAAADPKPAPPEKPAAATTPAPAPEKPPAKPAPAKSISGKVVGPDGKPVAGALARVIPMPTKWDGSLRGSGQPDVPKAITAKTDAAGAFRVEGLTGGPFVVRVELAGMAPAFASDVPAGAALNLHLKPGVEVSGRVLDLTTQRPVAGATVTILERDAARFGREAAHTLTTGEDGTFRAADCAPGVVAIEAIAPAKARARLDRVVAKAAVPGEVRKPEANTLYLQPGGRLAGRAIGPDGKPLADAFVAASASDGNLFSMFREGRAPKRTDADGKFSFDGVAAGNKYTLRATKAGLASREEGPILVEAGTDRSDIELKLEAGAMLSFRLVTAQDVPVGDVEARIQPQGGGRRRAMAFGSGDVDREKITAQGDGKFLIKSLDSGTFDLTLMPPDYADVTKEGVKLKSGETTDLGTLRVKESKSIAGRVTDTTGQPVAGASLSAMWIDADMRMSREAKTGADGRYRLSGLTDQPIRSLSVRATGFATATREAASPGDTAVDFTLERTGTIIGRVLLAGGAAPAAFRVQAFPEAKENQERPGFRVVVGGRGEEEQIFTDPSGNFRLENVEPGMVTIAASADGKAPSRKSGLAVASDRVVDAGTITLTDGRTLRGRVVAAKDDAPVPGATVSVSQPRGFSMVIGGDSGAGLAVSSLDGRFEIAGLEARTYAIDVSQPEYSPNSGRVEIAPDADTDDFVVKLSRGGAITGLVRDASKQPIANAGVLLTKVPMGGGPQTVATGPDGRYTFEKIAPGEYMVIRAPTGGGPLMLMGGMKQVAVREGETTTFDLDESSKINLTGRVLKGGQPVANSMMFFSLGDVGSRADLKQSRTDADGRYQVGLDAPGTYAVVVTAPGGFFGGGRSATPVQVPDQPSPVLDITLKSAGIAGRVLNAEGKPISGAVVSASANQASADGGGGHGGRAAQDQTDPDGSFLVEGLDPGAYTVSASASGYRSASLPPVTVANEDDVPSVDFRLEPGRTVRGRVLDSNGNGIAGAMIIVAPSGAPPAGRDSMPTTTDVNGTFIVTAPADGPIDVTAVSAGFPHARAIAVMPQEGDDLTLRAPRPARVRLSVLDGHGAGLPGARVSLRAVPEYLGSGYLGFMGGTAPTDGTGVTTVGTLAPGGYELTVTSGGKRATQAVNVTEGAEVAASVTLP